jgi:polysaccharide deacetylase family protein (PEP-CTERM system associated)
MTATLEAPLEAPRLRERAPRLSAMTVDVEEHFTVENLSGVVPRDLWPVQPMCADAQTRRLLDLFDAHGVKATFFILGWVAERHRGLVKEIHARGHEVAAHSYWHRLVFEMTPTELRADLRRVRDLLEDLTGARVVGYRAPTYSITRSALWAHALLAEEGFEYSSSIFPVKHDRYGIDDWPRGPRKMCISGRVLWEVPPTTLKFLGRNWPIAGGGYLRLFPARALARAIAHVVDREGLPAFLYVHPWEIDPEIPRYRQSPLRDFRGYVGLGSTFEKLALLCTRLRLTTVARVLEQLEAEGTA